MRKAIWAAFLAGLVALALAAAFAADTAPAITRQQIEADWLIQAERRGSSKVIGPHGPVTPAQDAAGGVDGVKDGKWGFHTAMEPDPWWQVDLGKPTSLDHILLYNRCDSCGERNTRIKVLLSDDGKAFRQAYQHDGTMFYGFPDKKPLSVAMKGAEARYVRLALDGTSYFHLDEVEVYPVGDTKNVALGKPATQSSVSEWSDPHSVAAAAPQSYPVARVVERGLALAKNLRGMGVGVEKETAALRQIGERLKAPNTPEAARQLYLDACWAVRGMALRNPLLDFDSLLFVKAAPGRFPHMSDQYYGWWSRPGGGVYLLQGFKSANPKLRCLTADLPAGSFLRPDLSYDGKKILFAYCRYHPEVPDLPNKASKVAVPEDAFYHVFEMNVDGTGRRQLTHGKYDDFDARYLPDGQIVFLSTRKGQFLQCTKANSMATLAGDLPDSYVRCGGDNYRPVPVFTLHAMDADGGNLHPISAFENFEWTPAVAGDGQIMYTRWDYIDRFNGHFFSLWSTRPDGTNPQLLYKNFTTRPQVALEPQSVPNSNKIVFTASAHHSITGGSLVLFDRARGTEGAEPIVRLTPEVPFPETEGNVDSYYANPYPLSEQHFLCAWSDRRLPPHARVDNTQQNPLNACGLYLYDAFGNLNLIYRDPDISCNYPIPVRPRVRPAVSPSLVDWDGPQEGAFMIQDVYQGLPDVKRGTIKTIRVVAVPPKVQPNMNSPSIGISAEDPGKFLLGSAPVAEDGSAYFRVPSGMPVFFQAVDGDGLAVQTMRSLTYVWPKETLSCVGCHEGREAAPMVQARSPLAQQGEPSRLAPGPEGTWPLRYDRLIQPVLDRACVSCHQAGGKDARAAALNLSGPKSYDALLNFAGQDLKKLAFEKDRSVVGECAARKSRLWAILSDPNGHEGVRLGADDLGRFAVWMDLYAQRQGHFSDQQEKQLEELRRQLAPILVESRPPGTVARNERR